MTDDLDLAAIEARTWATPDETLALVARLRARKALPSAFERRNDGTCTLDETGVNAERLEPPPPNCPKRRLAASLLASPGDGTWQAWARCFWVAASLRGTDAEDCDFDALTRHLGPPPHDAAMLDVGAEILIEAEDGRQCPGGRYTLLAKVERFGGDGIWVRVHFDGSAARLVARDARAREADAVRRAGDACEQLARLGCHDESVVADLRRALAEATERAAASAHEAARLSGLIDASHFRAPPARVSLPVVATCGECAWFIASESGQWCDKATGDHDGSFVGANEAPPRWCPGAESREPVTPSERITALTRRVEALEARL